MKKIISFILCVFVILSLSTTVSFAKTGDIIGYAKYTDISAYINHYPITSYNINDYTAVVAEDLRNYGFDVVWNDAERSLSITKNETATQITPAGTVYKYSLKAGQDSFAYLETDIVTYVNGSKVDSFNVDGKTCIYIDSLAPYGEIVWIPETRAIKFWLDGLPIADYLPIEEVPMVTMYAADGRTISVDQSEVGNYKNVGWYTEAEYKAKEKEKMIDVYASVLLRQYRSRMKDPSSFQLNAVYAGFDSSLYSGYDFVVVADVSGKNSYGGITRSTYVMLLKTESGNYILDLKGYADDRADDAWGGSKLQWMDVAINALKAQSNAASRYSALDTKLITKLVLSN